MTSVRNVGRRSFFQTAATVGGGLVLGFHLPQKSQAQQSGPLPLNAFVRIGTDDTITLMIHKAEMGQGTVTSLSQLLAEELECDWTKIRTEFPVLAPAYGMMGVYGSMSVRTSWEPLRQAGATARQMLVAAAAQKWGIDQSQCKAENSSVVNVPTSARLSYGALAETASKITPTKAPLKDPAQFKVIGKSVSRLDTPSKVNGTATFGIDVKIPGMLFASLERCPVFGGRLVSFDGTRAESVPGVKRVFQISNGVAVVASDTWSAFEGRKALQIEWDFGKWADESSSSLRQMFADLATKPGQSVRKVGDADAAFNGAAKKIEAIYEVPYLAHAPMEPLNCTAQVTADRCEIWAASQTQSAAQQRAAQITGFSPEKIRVHTQYLGGGFGRRWETDYVAEAVEIAKTMPGTPIKLTWTREDDFQHDKYRPASYVKFAGGLNADGSMASLQAHIVCPPFGGPGPAVEGIQTARYAIPNVQIDFTAPDTGTPVSYWRSVGYSQNTFFLEAFMDEMAAAGGHDPVEFRRRLLAGVPRLLGVLDLAAIKADWGKQLPAGRFRGVAIANNVGTYTAQIAEVSIGQGKVRVHRIVCAVDCGLVINPAIVAQQIQSGIVYGLSAALKTGITLEKGRVVQKNFNNFDPIRIDEMPVVEVHIVPSHENPSGIGEASVPAIAPAVANAVRAATGKPIRMLPTSSVDLG